MKRKAEETREVAAEASASKSNKENDVNSNKKTESDLERPVTIAKDRDEYLQKRLALLEKEKELTKMRDEVSKLRQELPWKEVSKEYSFEGPDGTFVSLQDLFQGKSQLIVHHFMFGPEWKTGCKSCSFMADHMTEAAPHLAAKDVAYVAIGRAPISKLQDFKTRMGWKTDFYSSNATTFNFDFGVAFRKEEYDSMGSVNYNFADVPFFMEDFPGISVFAQHEGKLFHTYSVYSRGLDPFITTYQFLDIVPKGRNEGGKENRNKMSWVKFHDEY